MRAAKAVEGRVWRRVCFGFRNGPDALQRVSRQSGQRVPRQSGQRVPRQSGQRVPRQSGQRVPPPEGSTDWAVCSLVDETFVKKLFTSSLFTFTFSTPIDT